MKVKAVQVPSMFDYYVLKSFMVNGIVRNKDSFEWVLEVGGFDKGDTWEHLRPIHIEIIQLIFTTKQLTSF